MRISLFVLLALSFTSLADYDTSKARNLGRKKLALPGLNWMDADATGASTVYSEFEFYHSKPITFLIDSFQFANKYCGYGQKVAFEVLKINQNTLSRESLVEPKEKERRDIRISTDKSGAYVLRVWLTGYDCLDPSVEFKTN